MMQNAIADNLANTTNYNYFNAVQGAETAPSAEQREQQQASYWASDRISLSQEGKDKSNSLSSPQEKSPTAGTANKENIDPHVLDELQQLKRRDIEVRSHEQAHLSAAGQYAKGGASFAYQKGADGKSYAVSGEVGIDMSKESTPEATINKMQTIKRAALAPASPSGADRQIAARATAKESEARKELLQETQENLLQSETVHKPGDNTTPSGQDINAGDSPSISTLKSALETYSKMAITNS